MSLLNTSFAFTAKSRNPKTGPISVVTISQDSCPDSCPLKTMLDSKTGEKKPGPCYGKTGPISWFWNALSNAGPGESYTIGKAKLRALGVPELVESIQNHATHLWRFAQIGDLPHDSGTINRGFVGDLITANRGKNGFGYTHHDMGIQENRALVAFMNRRGFCMNLSADSLSDADEKHALGIAPVVVIVSSESAPHKGESGADYRTRVKIKTPAGVPVVICPAQYVKKESGKPLTCKDCGLCAKVNRDSIVGFLTHGAKSKTADSLIAG